MSFYGSTYFQLIDTFYKILIKNKGGSAVTFPDSLGANEHASQASGRKGILEFGTGNRWIYATQDSGNPNSYVFWHSQPDTKTENLTQMEFKGGKNQVTPPAGATVVTLEPDTYIKAPVFKFDKAGHISTADHVYYKMPISQTEEAIEDLQNKVGEPASGGSESTGLFFEVDELNKHVDTVEEKADETIKQLGDFKELFPTRYWDTASTFYGSFGSMEDLREEFFDEVNTTKTFSEGFINFKETTEAGIQGNLDELRVHAGAISRHDSDIVTLNTEVAALKAKDTALDTVTDSLQQQINSNKSACDSNLAKEKLRAEAEESRIEGLVTTETNRAKGEESRIEGLVTAETNRSKGEESRIEGLVTTETGRAKGEESRIEGLVDTNATNITNLSDTVKNNKEAIEATASGLDTRIIALETNSATTVALNAVDEKTNANALAISGLDERIDTAEENTTSALQGLGGRIDGVSGRIDTLSNTVTTQGQTLSTKADSSAVSTLNERVSTLAEDTSTQLATKADNSALTALQTAMDNKADKTAIDDLDADIKLKANQSELNTLSELVNTKASQESLNDLAAAVDGAARADALEKYIAITDAKIAEMGAKIEELTARIEALENPTPPDEGGVEGE